MSEIKIEKLPIRRPSDKSSDDQAHRFPKEKQMPLEKKSKLSDLIDSRAKLDAE